MRNSVENTSLVAAASVLALLPAAGAVAANDEGTRLERLTIAAVGEDGLVGGEVPELVDDIRLAAFQDEAAEDTKDGTWRSKFTLAAAGSFGNTDTQALNVGFNSEREDADDRTLFDTRFFWGATDGDETENRFTAGIRQDWFIPDSRWFIFAQGRYDYDSFQSWDQRVTGAGGVGYKWIEKENYTNFPRIGLGFSKEWGSDDQRLTPEGLIGTDVTWQISDKQRITFSTTFYPDLGDLGEYRWVTVADWSVLVDEATNMSISAGLYNEYYSMVDPGTKHNDLKVYAGVSFDF